MKGKDVKRRTKKTKKCSGCGGYDIPEKVGNHPYCYGEEYCNKCCIELSKYDEKRYL